MRLCSRNLRCSCKFLKYVISLAKSVNFSNSLMLKLTPSEISAQLMPKVPSLWYFISSVHKVICRFDFLKLDRSSIRIDVQQQFVVSSTIIFASYVFHCWLATHFILLEANICNGSIHFSKKSPPTQAHQMKDVRRGSETSKVSFLFISPNVRDPAAETPPACWAKNYWYSNFKKFSIPN